MTLELLLRLWGDRQEFSRQSGLELEVTQPTGSYFSTSSKTYLSKIDKQLLFAQLRWSRNRGRPALPGYGQDALLLYNRENFLKELCDGVVTAAGVAHCADMAFVSAVEEVNASNWSKFNYKGFPEFDKNGKVKKGETYRPADMEGMV